jgi:cytochrome c
MSSRYGHPCVRLPYMRAGGCMTVAFLSAIALYVAAHTAAFAAGNAASGKRLYDTRCLGCHGDGSTAATLGPSLVGIIGRKAGTGESGVHSRALTESSIRWDETSLRWFLAAPIAGTTMPASVEDPQEIDDLIAYLKTLR